MSKFQFNVIMSLMTISLTVMSHPNRVPMKVCMSMDPQRGHGRPPMRTPHPFSVAVVQYPDKYKGNKIIII